ncbi:hypothetical protein GRI44_13205 [Altererythrobacter confluentis]|uniref:Uncharacterized protein n=1 Tax=Allopontixanthobacter confluentis TaxID=1849021 RepID=A0A6L7GIF2_9SPHN|nr:hypothetical protein [Allopontixanthobacter confluentis]MXP15707.1 hypothetical protein [Allopontixanthobacter confluentis]
MRLVLPLVAATALFAVSPAAACLYTQAPEPVGPASAPFFAMKMMQAAATADIAVAGETRTAFGSDPQWGISSTTFYVIDRLKGQSPDRFTLLVGAADVNSRDVEAMHWVDAKGRVTPYPYPVEAQYAVGGTRQLTSCFPGTLSVRAGESYLVYRDAEGRLLGRFALYEDLETAVFPLVRAGLGTREGWAAMILAPVADETAVRNSAPAIRSDRTRVYFPTPLTLRAAQRWLRERDLLPYAVRVTDGEMLDETTIAPEQASASLVERALADARENEPGGPLQTLARAMAAVLNAATLESDGLLRRHAFLVADAARRSQVQTGEWLVAGFDLTGSPAAIGRLRGQSGDATIIDPFLTTRVVTADFSDAARTAVQNEASWQETSDSLLARLSAVAEGRPVPDAVAKPPEPEPDPFSYTDCIRFGREESALLANLPEVGRMGDLQIFGDPDAAQCRSANGTLSCSLAPSTSVRVIWAGWEGGFHVNPRGVTLTANGDGLQCGGG